jgi:hypothetical protein
MFAMTWILNFFTTSIFDQGSRFAFTRNPDPLFRFAFLPLRFRPLLDLALRVEDPRSLREGVERDEEFRETLGLFDVFGVLGPEPDFARFHRSPRVEFNVSSKPKTFIAIFFAVSGGKVGKKEDEGEMNGWMFCIRNERVVWKIFTVGMHQYELYIYSLDKKEDNKERRKKEERKKRKKQKAKRR